MTRDTHKKFSRKLAVCSAGNTPSLFTTREWLPYGMHAACVLTVKKQRRLVCDIQQLQTALQYNNLTKSRHNTAYLPDLTCSARLLCMYPDCMCLLLAALPSPDVTASEGVALAWYAHAPTHAHTRAHAASRTRSRQHFLGLEK